ncbi:MAG: hypothetical protein KME26_32605 [Oscillatoria princeps RMCB-10]|jgi:hypothetical protein|nr:hypothetical protein [Oscillatoria princeps RMCB-10]
MSLGIADLDFCESVIPSSEVNGGLIVSAAADASASVAASAGVRVYAYYNNGYSGYGVSTGIAGSYSQGVASAYGVGSPAYASADTGASAYTWV